MASSRNPEEFLRASPGRDRYTRLTRLLLCGGTAVLRELFDSIHLPANLSAVLTSRTVSSTLNRMRRNRLLTFPQWKILFPSPGTCGESKTFDITLLCKLLREICSLTAPATGWDSLPNITDLSLTADLARIKYLRNEIYGHVNGDMDLSDDEFVRLWEEIKDALLRIVNHYAPSGSTLVTDWENAIDNLLTTPLTHEDEIHLEELQHWYLEEMEVKKTLEEMRRTAEETRGAAEETRDILRTIVNTDEKVKTMRNMLPQKDQEMKAPEEQYKRDLENAKSKACASDEDSELDKKYKEHSEKLKEANEQLQLKKAYIDSLEPKLSSSAEKVKELEEMLSQKDHEMKAVEERYKRYLEKAKNVIKTLDPKQRPSANAERDHEKMRITREREEKLIVGAWYEMGMQLHRKASEDRLLGSSGGMSFLARQRQASSRRTSTPSRTQNNAVTARDT